MSKSQISRLSLFLATILLVGCDHATKFAAKSELKAPVTLIKGVFDLTYAENRDTAFSLLDRFGIKGGGPVLFAVSVLMLIGVGVAWYLRRNIAPRLEQAAYVLVFAGALGNVLDRVLRGYVIDFMHVHHWPVFNVADCAIVVGALLFAFTARRPKQLTSTV